VIIHENFELKRVATYNVGGPARYYCEPTTIEEVQEALTRFEELQVPLFVLGRGSNLLISDKGIDAGVINTINLSSIDINGTNLRVGAGALLTKTVMKAVTAGLAGMEDLAGIPGSVGGGILMNAGAYSQTISEKLTSVTWIDLNDYQLRWSTRDDLTFGYRTSSFKQERAVILEATFKLVEGDATTLREKVLATQEKRRNSQPLNLPSCGSVFKRPEGNYAGGLIEAAGLKGYRVGGAEVSVKHANFIVNRGTATAEDIRTCISDVRRTVFEHSGILLEPEVIFVGEFDSLLFDSLSESPSVSI